ncbi:conserved hypothetical protein, partial [Trichinella spiralis]|uniref:hypothetical protein n=1 Tax=Trichinella spiralis TaxID=6334 RepID=UPI0001EFDCD0
TSSIIWLNLCLAHFYGILLVTNTEILAPLGYREMFNKHLVQKSCVMNFDFPHDNRCIAFFIIKFVDKASFVAIVKRHYVRIMKTMNDPDKHVHLTSLCSVISSLGSSFD